MTFTIGETVLPIFPKEINRKLSRKPRMNVQQFGFPVPTDTGPQSFNLQIKGLIWDQIKAEELWELTKDAEGEVISVSVTEENYTWVNGLYSCTRSTVSKKKFQTVDDGGVKEVWNYDLTFTQYAETGAFEPGDVGGIDFDEPGIGFGSFEEIFGPWDFDVFSFFTDIYQ